MLDIKSRITYNNIVEIDVVYLRWADTLKI